MRQLINRQKLYDLLWSKDHSVKSIANDFGMTQGNLREICKYLAIPIPKNTEKNKIYDNYYVQRKSLSSKKGIPEELEVVVKKEGLKTVIDYKGKNDQDNQLDFLSEMERYNLLKKTDEVRKSVEFDSPLSNSLKTKKKQFKREYKKSSFPYLGQSIHTIRNDYFRYKKQPLNNQVFAYESIDKIFDVLGCIEEIIVQFDGYIDENYIINIGEEKVKIEFYEMQKTVPHIVTKEEQKQIDRWEKDKWYKKPRIRKEDFVFDGRLVLLIEASKYDSELKYRFWENDKKSLLDQLMEIIVAIYVVSEEERKIRLKREEQERQENLRKEAEEIYFDLYNEELKSTKELIMEAEDFFLAKKVFDYIEYRKENDKDINSEWVKWASKKAHWIATGKPEVNNILGNKKKGTNILEIREKY